MGVERFNNSLNAEFHLVMTWEKEITIDPKLVYFSVLPSGLSASPKLLPMCKKNSILATPPPITEA